MKTLLKKALLSLIVVASLCLVVFGAAFTKNASAASNVSVLTTKSLMEEVYRCYKKNHYKTTAISIEDYTGYNSIVNKDEKVRIPSILHEGEISCTELMTGVGSKKDSDFAGVLKMAGYTTSVKGKDAANLLQDLQFTKETSGGDKDGSCYRMKFKSVVTVGNSIDLQTNRVCFYSDNTASVKNDGASSTLSFKDKVYFTTSDNKVTLHLKVDQHLENGKLPSDASDCTVESSGGVTCPISGKNGKDTLDMFISYIYALGNVSNDANQTWTGGTGSLTYNAGSTGSANNIVGIKLNGTNQGDVYISGSTGTDMYKLTMKMDGTINQTAMAAVAVLSEKLGTKISEHDKLKFNVHQKFAFFQEHLLNYWSIPDDDIICKKSEFAALSSSDWKDARIYIDGKIKQCKVSTKNAKNKSNKIYAFNDDYFSTTNQMSLDEVLAWMNDKENNATASKVGNILAVPMTAGTSVIDTEEESTDAKDDPCFKGAGALGWILCPVVDALAGLENTIYSLIEENFLQLPAAELFNREDGVYQAWSVIQTIANVLFVIFFLVIIFSQLTGVGIDNYGIKRMLPRLIIAAVLVNFSYIICQLLVDISNIVGASVNDLFHSFAGATVQEYAVSSDSDPIQGTVFVVLGITIIAANIFFNPAIIVTFVIAAVNAVIAIFFMWMVLVAREVGVILAVVLSPLALVLYMLPNFNSVFKRWRDLLTGLLLVYPLCGLLIGGSFFVSVLIGNLGANFSDIAEAGMSIAAMLVRVMPFFALPTLFRSSLRAMGNLGDRIQGFRNGITRGVSDWSNRSEAVNRLRTNVNNASFGGLRDRAANTAIGRMTGFTSRRTSQMGAYDKMRKGDREDRQLLQKAINDRRERNDPTSVIPKNMEADALQAARAGDEDRYNAIMADFISRHGASAAAEAHRNNLRTLSAANGGNGEGLMDERRRSEFLRNFNANHSQIGDKDYTLRTYMENGGRDANTSYLTTFDTHSADIDWNDIKTDEIARSSSKNIERMIVIDPKNNNHKHHITQDMAQQVMRNKQLFGQMDRAQQLMIAKLAKENTRMKKDDVLNWAEHHQKDAVDLLAPLPVETT